jgi:hypothetical protein
MNCSDIQDFLQNPDTENATVEFKLSAFLDGEEHHNKLCKEITGISNVGGGCILLGIAPEKSFEGKDIFPNPDEVKGLITNLLRDSVSPQINCKISLISCPEGDVIAIEIPPKGNVPHAIVKRKGHEIESRSVYIRNDHGLQLADDNTLASLYQQKIPDDLPETISNPGETTTPPIIVNYSPKIKIETPESREIKRQRNTRIIEIGIIIVLVLGIYLSTMLRNILWLSVTWSVLEGVCFSLSVLIFTRVEDNQKYLALIIDSVFPILLIIWGILVNSTILVVIGWIATACFWSLMNLQISNVTSVQRRNVIAHITIITYAVILLISSNLIQDTSLIFTSEIVGAIVVAGYILRFGVPCVIWPGLKLLKKAIVRGILRRQIDQLQQEIARRQDEHRVLYPRSKDYQEAQARLNILIEKLADLNNSG